MSRKIVKLSIELSLLDFGTIIPKWPLPLHHYTVVPLYSHITEVHERVLSEECGYDTYIISYWFYFLIIFFLWIFCFLLILDNIDHIHKRELVCRYHHICDWQSPEVLRRTQRVSDSFPGRWNLITHSKIWCDSLENSC